jgi:hypothetical protein
MDESLSEFWAVKCAGTTHRLSEEEAMNVRKKLISMPESTSLFPHLFQVTDIYGCTILMDLKSIGGIWNSTPELREAESKHQKILEKEWEAEF